MKKKQSVDPKILARLPEFDKSVFVPVYVPKDEADAKRIQDEINRINLRDGVSSDRPQTHE